MKPRAVLILSLLTFTCALPAMATDFSIFGSYWDTDVAGNVAGGGLGLAFPFSDSWGLELRATYFEELTDDPIANAFDSDVVHCKTAGMNAHLGKPFRREDLVIAPYASALALLVEPEAACENLQRLATEGNLGKFGFYEAVDYTPSRIPRGQSRAVVRSYMAHHQGMALVALGNVINHNVMVDRFHADPMVEATAKSAPTHTISNRRLMTT